MVNSKQFKINIRLISLVLIPAVLIGGVLAYLAYNAPPKSLALYKPTSVVEPLKELAVSDINTTELFTLTNQDRADVGLAPLKLNSKLNASALAKCNDMVEKVYWAHDDPSGRTPWHFIDEQGVSYKKVGENLAESYVDAMAVNNGWMLSPGHKANINDALFNNVGYAVCKGLSPQGSVTLITVQHLAKL